MRTVVIRWLLALLALLGAVGISFLFERSGNHYAPQVLGKNNTVLFLTTDHYGYCNVHLATAFALLQNQPHIAVRKYYNIGMLLFLLNEFRSIQYSIHNSRSHGDLLECFRKG